MTAWKMVPCEPTKKMVHAAAEDGFSAEEHVRAAIAAAPEWEPSEEDAVRVLNLYFDGAGYAHAPGGPHDWQRESIADMCAALKAVFNCKHPEDAAVIGGGK